MSKTRKKNFEGVEEVLDWLLSTTPNDMETTRGQADRMLEFSNKIVENITEFAKESTDNSEWAASMLMGLARATSITIRGLEKTGDIPNSDLMEHYVTRVLPLCDLVTQRYEIGVEEVMDNIDAD